MIREMIIPKHINLFYSEEEKSNEKTDGNSNGNSNRNSNGKSKD